MALDAAAQAILKEYEQTLVLPTSKSQPQFTLCPVGLTGSGKTTVATALSEKLDLLRICRDDMRRISKQKNYDYSTSLNEMTRYIIEKYLQQGYNIAIDADCIGSVREYMDQMQQRIGIVPVWIHINPPESFMIANNSRRTFENTNGLFKDADAALAAYERRKPLHQHLTLPFVYTFDPSKDNFNQQIDEACEKIREYLHR